MAEHQSLSRPSRMHSQRGSSRYQQVDDEPQYLDCPRTTRSPLSEPEPSRHEEDTTYVPLRNLSLKEDDSILDPKQPPLTSTKRTFKQWWNSKFLLGWRAGALSCAVGSTVVFLINLIATIWATSAHGLEDGQAVLFEGSCPRSKSLNTWIHLLINTLSTILLSSSNYCMQCLSAPTREEVERAHSRGVWLDIGVPSFRNLRHIRKLRVLLWVVLGMSSLPLHLFYNSAVFSTIFSTDPITFTVTPAFVASPRVKNLKEAYHANQGDLRLSYVTNGLEDILEDMYKNIHDNSTKIEYLQKDECITAYAQDYLTNRASVVMLASDFNQPGNLSILAMNRGYHSSISGPTHWICRQYARPNDSSYLSLDNRPACRDHLNTLRTDPTGWRPYEHRVEECYSQRVDERCKVQFSLYLAVVVISLNALKAAIMYYLAYKVVEDPLMTMGDGLSSFLRREDAHSESICLTSKKLLTCQDFRHQFQHPRPLRYRTQARRWYGSASAKRWVICISMIVLTLIIVSSLLGHAINSNPNLQSARGIGQLGLGEINPLGMIAWDHLSTQGSGALISNAIIANIPQVLLSVLYFSYNSLVTCLFLAQEWKSYENERKSLRISTVPMGSQRETYFLQLPYRYALPLMGASALLHWLVSQSIFLVSIEELQITGLAGDGYITQLITCGYSPLAIILVIVVGGLMVLGILGIGARKFRGGMPVVGSCSVAMAAACHQSKGKRDPDAWKKRLMWGVESEDHCAFSAEPVDLPVEGKFYS